jgi:hypothetical protein
MRAAVVIGRINPFEDRPDAAYRAHVPVLHGGPSQLVC